jgi:hypothetical protein
MYLPDTPGPVYDLSSTSFVKQNQAKGKGYTMGKRPHAMQSEQAPGPARYTLKRDFDGKGQGSQYSFTGKARGPSAETAAPGPGAYFKNGAPTEFQGKGQKAKGFTLSGRTRIPTLNDGDIPGPARYDTRKFDPTAQSQSSLSRAGTSSFLGARRPAPGSGDDTPGPKYNIVPKVGGNKTNGRATTMGARLHQARVDEGPGPAKYLPTLPGESEAARKSRGCTMGAPLNPGASTYITSNLARKILLKDQVEINNTRP